MAAVQRTHNNTDDHQIQRQLEEAQALTHLGNWQWDIAVNRISWSDELYRIFGLRPQEREIGFEEFISLIHPEDRERIRDIINTSYQTKKPFDFEHRILMSDGRVRTAYGKGKVNTDSDGNPVRMFGTTQDITERKAAERALGQSDERFRAVTAATHDLVYDLDLERKLMWFNDVLQSEYGYPAKKERSLQWWKSCIHPDDALRVEEELAALLVSGQQTWHAEYRFRKADGSYAVVRNRAYLVLGNDGAPDRVVGSCLDITQQKQLDRAKDEFISLVSHQLRTPLTVIRLYGNMLGDGVAGPLDTTQADYVHKMTDASIRLVKLVGDILNISRLELNKIKVDCQPTDVNSLIAGCVEEFATIAAEKQATVTYNHPPKLAMVPLDATIFGEIVRNLISNGLRYAKPKGGTVDVSFRQSQHRFVLTVKDNGIGIPASDQSKVFDRFFRASNAAKVDGEGSGLGLYLVKLFAEAAGGKIWLRSTEGKGTSFYASFPLDGVPAVNPITPARTADKKQ